MKRKNTIISAVVSTLLGGILLDCYMSSFSIDTIILFFEKVKNMTKEVLLYQISLWVVLLVILGVISLIVLIWCLYERKPNFLKYRTDTVYGIIWKWNWRRENKGWDIDELVAHCPKDKTPLTHENRCPRCGLLLPAYDKHIMEKVRILIKDNALKEFLKCE